VLNSITVDVSAKNDADLLARIVCSCTPRDHEVAEKRSRSMHMTIQVEAPAHQRSYYGKPFETCAPGVCKKANPSPEAIKA